MLHGGLVSHHMRLGLTYPLQANSKISVNFIQQICCTFSSTQRDAPESVNCKIWTQMKRLSLGYGPLRRPSRTGCQAVKGYTGSPVSLEAGNRPW